MEDIVGFIDGYCEKHGKRYGRFGKMSENPGCPLCRQESEKNKPDASPSQVLMGIIQKIEQSDRPLGYSEVSFINNMKERLETGEALKVVQKDSICRIASRMGVDTSEIRRKSRER